ncbi:MAG: hypothetical protein J0I12_21175 [Candidatus Eremiobacteraeota bacterium]|nr:hypothetical protein [Candidatus Eremiobacteraeota bacterium]
MIWLILRLSLFAVVLAVPHPRTLEAELSYLVGLLIFDLLWLLQRRYPELRTIASLLFSMVLGATGLVYLAGGSLVSLGFLWPSLMLRLDTRPAAERRLNLVALQIALVTTAPLVDLPIADGLRLVPVVLSLLQIRSGRVSSWANLGTLVWILGMLVPAYLFSSGLTAAALARNLLLATLPQLGLRWLYHD